MKQSLLGVVVAAGQPPYQLASSAPAAMAPIGNRPIVEHVLAQFREAGVQDLVLAIDERDGERVRELVRDGSAFGLRARYVELGGWYGCAHAIAMARLASPMRNVVAHMGDGLLGQPLAPLIDRFASEGLDALIAIPDERAAADAFGFGILGAAALEAIDGLRPKWHGKLDIDEAMCEVARSGGSVAHAKLERWWRFDGTRDSLLAGNRTVLDEVHRSLPEANIEDSQVDGRVEIHPTASVSSSVLHGPVVIGEGARISDAFVGPYTAIGSRAVIDAAEIENSVVMADASVRHVSARMAECVIGRGARVFRSFALPRTTRLLVGDAMEVAFV